MKLTSLVLLLTVWILILPGIIVNGHISEDTTWTPEDSPYIVSSFLYIDAGVTLTIEPGVDVKITGADKSNIYNYYWNGSEEPIAKMIIVYGQIDAFGTEELPITIDVNSENEGYRWGGIYIGRYAPMSSFEYCVIKRSFFCILEQGTWSMAAIQFDNGLIHMRHNTFINNMMAIKSFNLLMNTVVYDCKFYSNDTDYPVPFGYPGCIGLSAYYLEPPERNFKVTIAKCYFTGEAGIGGGGYYADTFYLNNFIDNSCVGSDSLMWDRDPGIEYGSASSYGNYVLNGNGGFGCNAYYETDIAFSRRNTLIKYPDTFDQFPPLRIGGSGRGTSYVSDNYLEGAVQFNTNDAHSGNSMIYNNVMLTADNTAMELSHYSSTNLGGQMKIFNNLVVNFHPDSLFNSRLFYTDFANPYIFNNTFSGFYRGALNFMSSISCYNNIFHEFYLPPSYGYSAEQANIYGYNCTNLPIPQTYSIIDVGGNIVADPSFMNPEAGDYSLQQSSVCIDAGLILPDLPAFDIRYHKRIAPGTEDGLRNLDMGAYEYNSIYIGGIRAIIFDAESGEPVDCVKAQIANKLPEFSDTLGCFHYPTGAGIYSLNLSHWDYETAIIANVEITEGEDLMLQIPLHKQGVSNPTDDQIPETPLYTLTNYPNPFNPQTRISYILPSPGKVNLSIYNIKGQKLIGLCDTQQTKGHHSIIWDGKDQRGKNVASGLYFARLEHDGFVQSRKMMMLK